MSKIITQSAEETKQVASELLSRLNGTNILLLYGDLGSGKTTFSQGIGEALGISQRMVSPTFLLVRKYDLQPNGKENMSFHSLYHIDLYRVGGDAQLDELGIFDFIQNPSNLVVIEWAERMGTRIPLKRIDVKFETLEGEQREISISEL
ncbi:MAG: hypothetical protein RLZZ455_927 [Candidatus Parcubacteria bacterium]|jgi:tRNA threonylcarbamoyladenosine biosynthesis protein TsaE